MEGCFSCIIIIMGEREVWLVGANYESPVEREMRELVKSGAVSLDKVVVSLSRPGTFRPSQARPGQARHNTVKGSAQSLKCTCCTQGGIFLIIYAYIPDEVRESHCPLLGQETPLTTTGER